MTNTKNVSQLHGHDDDEDRDAMRMMLQCPVVSVGIFLQACRRIHHFSTSRVPPMVRSRWCEVCAAHRSRYQGLCSICGRLVNPRCYPELCMWETDPVVCRPCAKARLHAKLKMLSRQFFIRIDMGGDSPTFDALRLTALWQQ